MKLGVFFNLDLTLTRMQAPFEEITGQVFAQMDVPVAERDAGAFATLFFEELGSGDDSPWEAAFRRYFDRRGLSRDSRVAAESYVERELEAVRPVSKHLKSIIRSVSERAGVGLLTRGVGRVQWAKLDRLGIADALDAVVISHEEGESKADGRLFRVAESRLSADHYIYVSTHQEDVEYARDAGWQGLLVDRETLGGQGVDWLPGFRVNAGAVLQREDGRILMARRSEGGEHPWQFPQGGVHEGEVLEEAMWREVGEELGLERPREICEVVEQGPAVRYPFASPGPDYVGQEQTLFLLHFSGSDSDIRLAHEGEAEFDAVQWVSPEESVDYIVPAKRRVLRRTYESLSGVEWPGGNTGSS